ncbi:MAG: glycosyltransferase family 4 protein [Candidatus Omnitrophota bacterium]
MRILFFLKGSREQASSKVRGFYVADELRKLGVHCDIVYGKARYLAAPFKLLANDIIFFHRCYFGIDIVLNRALRKLGKKTVFDIDDHPAGVILSGRKKKNATAMIRECSAATMGSHALLEFAKKCNENAHLIPSPIAVPYYRPESARRESDHIVLGWVGHGKNYKKDLWMLLGPMERLGRKFKIKLIIAGALKQKEIYENFGRIKNIEVEFIDWIDSKDPSAVGAVISRFDIGLYPLLDREYNLYKCSSKGLEYMAMEKPFVASPVGENSYAFSDGEDGFFARTEDEWEDRLSRLIEDPSLRQSMGKKGRAKVETGYSTEMWAKELKKIFESLV